MPEIAIAVAATRPASEIGCSAVMARSAMSAHVRVTTTPVSGLSRRWTPGVASGITVAPSFSERPG